MTITRRFEFRILWMIAFITIINYFDRSAISYTIEPLERELGLTTQQFGFAASAFGMGYLIVTFFSGLLIDRYGSILVWAIGAICWSLATIAMSLVEGFASIFCLRVILGLAEAVHFPALLKTIADWLQPAYRARSISFCLLGVPFASVLGAPFITFLMESLGWRWMFVVLGLLGLLWGAYWLISFRDKKNPHRGVEVPAELLKNTLEVSRKISWKHFLSNKGFIANCCVYFIFGYIVFFALIWLPGYLQQTHGVTIGKTGWMVMIPWMVSSVLIVAGGWSSDFLYKRFRSAIKARSYPIALGMFLSALSFFLILYSNRVETDLLLLSFGLGFSFLTNAPLFALTAQLFPERVGVAQGIASTFFALSGIASPALTGWLVQISGDYQSAIFLVSGLALIASLIALLRSLLPKGRPSLSK